MRLRLIFGGARSCFPLSAGKRQAPALALSNPDVAPPCSQIDPTYFPQPSHTLLERDTNAAGVTPLHPNCAFPASNPCCCFQQASPRHSRPPGTYQDPFALSQASPDCHPAPAEWLLHADGHRSSKCGSDDHWIMAVQVDPGSTADGPVAPARRPPQPRDAS